LGELYINLFTHYVNECACRINKRLETISFESICYMSHLFVISLTLKYPMK